MLNFQPPMSEKYQKIFQLFSRQPGNTVNKELIPNLLRQAGYTITNEEADSIIASIIEDEVDIDKFIEIAESTKNIPVNVNMIRAAFHLYDREKTGYINVGLFKNLLQEEHDRLDDLEVDEIVRFMNPDSDGRINYEAWLKTIGK